MNKIVKQASYTVILYTILGRGINQLRKSEKNHLELIKWKMKKIILGMQKTFSV